jgi:hypothetical protein
LPIFLINPARRRRSAKKNPVKGSIRRVASSSPKGARKPSKKKPAARKPATTNPQGKKKMAKKRRKLSGAALAARNKRLAKARRSRGRKKNPSGKNPKRVAAGKKGAAAKKRKAVARAYHSGTIGYAAGIAKRKKRKKGKTAKKRTARKGKLTKAQRAAASRKGWRNRRRAGTAPAKKRRVKMTKTKRRARSRYGLKTLQRRHPRIKKLRKRKGASQTRAWMHKHGYYKINPSNGMMNAVKQVLPIAGAFYVSKLISNKLGDLPAVSGLTSKLNIGGYALHKPVLSGVILAAAHYGSKKGALAKHRTGLMLGTALAFVDSIVSTFAPPDVKKMMGVGEYVSMSEYVSMNEYVSSGEYVSTGGYGSLGRVITPGHGEPAYNYDDSNPHGLYAVDGLHEVHAIHGIDEELGMIEAGVDTGNNNGIFANGW